VRQEIKLLVSRILKVKLVQKAAVWSLIHASFAFPIKPLRQTTHWMAFCHPNPVYPVHIVVVPKVAWSDWLAVDPAAGEMMREFIELTQSMIRDFELAPAGYRLITNGGRFQTFPHLHFHLIAGAPYPQHDKPGNGEKDE
jgi:histidine triad (HIT) family protein